ncbi:MAG TPA: maleylpyruvate isomerase family mycothiol-dependent enzyme [Nocardioides sp.]|nr:maleylpyruvate isomerase family mycothiol-dependent enzyme [Nocardioides sp.]
MSGKSTEVTAERRLQAMQAYAERMAENVGAADSDAAVPTCPGWTVADLVKHVGETQNWVSDIIERRIADPSQLPTEMAPLPTEPGDWPAWLSDGAARAVEAFSDEALEAPVFNAAADDRTGGEFWLSSLLNETVIHGADAAYAAGRDYDVDADIAADLITNHLQMLTSSTWAAQRPESANALRGTGETLRLRATDDPGEWFIERGPEGATWQARSGEADVSVSGPASSLLLILTRRRQLADETDRVSVDGDPDLFRHWIENSAHIAD